MKGKKSHANYQLIKMNLQFYMSFYILKIYACVQKQFRRKREKKNVIKVHAVLFELKRF